MNLEALPEDVLIHICMRVDSDPHLWMMSTIPCVASPAQQAHTEIQRLRSELPLCDHARNLLPHIWVRTRQKKMWRTFVRSVMANYRADTDLCVIDECAGAVHIVASLVRCSNKRESQIRWLVLGIGLYRVTPIHHAILRYLTYCLRFGDAVIIEDVMGLVLRLVWEGVPHDMLLAELFAAALYVLYPALPCLTPRSDVLAFTRQVVQVPKPLTFPVEHQTLPPG